MITVSIESLDKAEVLAALYNASSPQGLGFLQDTGKDMSIEEARSILDNHGHHFDYLLGRVMKVDLSEDSFNSAGYDRDNGIDAAKRIIDLLRDTGLTSSEEGEISRKETMFKAAQRIQDNLDTKTAAKDHEGIRILTLGIDHHKDALAEKLNKVLD